MDICGRRGALVSVVILALALLAGCGRAAGGEVVTGQLHAAEREYWLVGTTLVAIGGARIDGEPSQVGATVRAAGRRQADGVFAATRITVGEVGAGASAASLPEVTANGVVEAIDAATGRWQIAGRQVQLALGVAAPGGIAVGDRAAARGFALADGVLLAAEVAPERAAPAAPSTGAVPAPKATLTTAAPSPKAGAIRVEAWVSDPTPPRSARMTVTGALLRGDAGIAGVPMRTVWHFRTGDTTCQGKATGPDGRTACTLSMSGATSGYEVVVDVIFEFEGRTYQTKVSFTPR
jgi:hypothetical protein